MARYLALRANLVIGLAFAISGVLAAHDRADCSRSTRRNALSHMMGRAIDAVSAFIATVDRRQGQLDWTPTPSCILLLCPLLFISP